MTPGQLGPTRRDLDWLFSAFTTWGSTRHKAALEQSKQMRKTHSDFVRLRDALGNANNQANLILYRLNDGVGSIRRRHVQHGCVWLGLANGL